MYGNGFGDDPFPFLNLGYFDSSSQPANPGDPFISERLSERLYDRVVAGADQTANEVLEVGCGRGGGCARIARGRPDARVVGLDRSSSLISRCNRAYGDIGNVSFEHGDALDLPYPDESFDLVVNVESSHCYGSRAAFFGEVTRVLAPGGHFAYADVVLPAEPDQTAQAIEDQLARAGLTILDAEDIVAGVRKARSAVSRSPAFRERIASITLGKQGAETLQEILFIEGSTCYARLHDGSLGYWRWLGRKP